MTRINAQQSKPCIRSFFGDRLCKSVFCTAVAIVGLINVPLVAHAQQAEPPAGNSQETTSETQVDATASNELFDSAIEAAQQRTVKVYGASVGRVEPYGTGILVSNDGLVLTASGIYLTGPRIRVGLPDGRIMEASLVRTDRPRQLALLKIDAETPNYFQLTKEDVGEKGDWVVTFSNAFKVANGDEPMSVNLGVITLRTFIEAMRNDRDVAYRGPLVLIDAITSNPGAAGGAVVNLEGKLVGMIGKLIESNDTNTRLNYAVPTSLLLDFVNNELRDDEPGVAEVETQPSKPADLGIRLFGLNGPRSPAYVDRVAPGGPGFKAKIRPDDLIISLDGEKINSIRDFQEKLKTLRPGESVVIVVKRGDDLLRIDIVPVEK